MIEPRVRKRDGRRLYTTSGCVTTTAGSTRRLFSPSGRRRSSRRPSGQTVDVGSGSTRVWLVPG